MAGPRNDPCHLDSISDHVIFHGEPHQRFYPPSQRATGINPWMNAMWVTLRSLGEGGYASAGYAEF